MDLAEESQTSVPRADVIRGDPHARGLTAFEDRAQTIQILYGFAFRQFKDDAAGPDAVRLEAPDQQRCAEFGSLHRSRRQVDAQKLVFVQIRSTSSDGIDAREIQSVGPPRQ